jgi:hypothetical protein
MDGGANMLECESLRGMGSPMGTGFSSGVHSRSLTRIPSECEENKSDDDYDENMESENNNVEDRTHRGMATATIINNRMQSSDLEDSLYGEIESVNSFESEHGGATHYTGNTESSTGGTVNRAVRINGSASNTGQYGGSNTSEEKDSEEEEEVIILSLVLNPNDGCVINPSDSSYYDSKIFDSALDREDALIYL